MTTTAIRRILPVFLFAGLVGVPTRATAQQVRLIDTIAGTGKPGDGTLGNSARTTALNLPFGLTFGPDGMLYITEVGRHRIHKLDPSSGKLSVVAGTGSAGYDGDGGPAHKAALNEPYEICFDRSGNAYFVEMQNHLVRRIDSRKGAISTVAGDGSPGFAGDGGRPEKARFRNPHSITIDDEGRLYVADIGNHRIRRIDLAKERIESIAGNGEQRLPEDGQPVLDRPMWGPRALAISGRRLWIALREGHSVWRLDLSSGVIHHVAGSGKSGYTGDGGAAAEATFNGPKGIAVGADGSVYVVDTENQAIRRIDGRTRVITTVAGGGPDSRGYGGDGGPASKAQLNRPHGICVGPDGALYIGDSENHRVRRIAP